MNEEKLIGYVATGAVSLAVGYALKRLEARPRVIWYAHQPAMFSVQGQQGQQPIQVHTQTITLQNLGRAKAENIEIVHSFQPAQYQLQPPVSHTGSVRPDGRHVLQIAALAPKEIVTMQVLLIGQLPVLEAIRCDNSLAKPIPVWFTRRFPNWVNYTIQALSLTGLAFVIYWLAVFGVRIFNAAFP